MNATASRCIALYPGAFRPPHADHFEVVRRLAERADVDEVIVIVSNRNRDVPGTTRVLGVELARAVWTLYLRALPKARVELASGSAVRHALARLERATPADRYLLVVGGKDFARRRARFDELGRRAGGASVAFVRGAPNVVHVSATELRLALATGATARPAFFRALPRHLSAAEKRQVWSMCRDAMRERHESRSAAIVELLRARGVGVAGSVETVRARKRDEVYRVELLDGRRVFVKTANDTVSAARIGDSATAKPRHRLKVEHTALKHVRAHVADAVEVPEVLCFERSTRTIVFAELCPGGHHLDDDLRCGRFERPVARRLAGFLADCHVACPPPAPLWDTPERELEHWREMLGLATTAPPEDRADPSLVESLERLRRSSDAARVAGFVHLDFGPRNVLVNAHDIGVLDFELAASVGDPAFDAGSLLGAYLHAGLRAGAPGPARAAIEAIVLRYAAGVGRRWGAMSGRTLAFAGAALLREARGSDGGSVGGREAVVTFARLLLAHAGGAPLACAGWLCESLSAASIATPG